MARLRALWLWVKKPAPPNGPLAAVFRTRTKQTLSRPAMFPWHTMPLGTWTLILKLVLVAEERPTSPSPGTFSTTLALLKALGSDAAEVASTSAVTGP